MSSAKVQLGKASQPVTGERTESPPRQGEVRKAVNGALEVAKAVENAICVTQTNSSKASEVPDQTIASRRLLEVYYGNFRSGVGLLEVHCDAPTQVSLDTALEVFRALDQRSGFMGINLDERFVVQFACEEQGGVRVELLDTSRPAIDACVADAQFVERLIRTAAGGHDVFRIARASEYEWEHTDMGS